jgi:Ca2+-dependent lipid-binding protein
MSQVTIRNPEEGDVWTTTGWRPVELFTDASSVLTSDEGLCVIRLADGTALCVQSADLEWSDQQ